MLNPTSAIASLKELRLEKQLSSVKDLSARRMLGIKTAENSNMNVKQNGNLLNNEIMEQSP